MLRDDEVQAVADGLIPAIPEERLAGVELPVDLTQGRNHIGRSASASLTREPVRNTAPA